MNIKEIEGAIEAILFTSGEAVHISQLSEALEIDTKSLSKILKDMCASYGNSQQGIKIIQLDKSYQMCTNPDYADYVQKLIKLPPRKILTQTLLETMAIIAYKQPVTKSQIEEIRGVNADHAVNKLMEYGLVCEKGRLDVPGKPILFGTTEEFLRRFGFSGLQSLPALETNIIDN